MDYKSEIVESYKGFDIVYYLNGGRVGCGRTAIEFRDAQVNFDCCTGLRNGDSILGTCAFGKIENFCARVIV